MKIKTLKTYQSVRFNNKDETHIDLRIPRFEDVQMDFDPKSNFVVVSAPGKESVLVFVTNIAYAIPAEEKQKSKNE